MSRRWRCRNCEHVSAESELLTAASPFDPAQRLMACPLCKCCDEGFEMLCDEPGCQSEVSSGRPTGNASDAWGGYRNTCSKHSKWMRGAGNG